MLYLRSQLRRKPLAYCFTNPAGEHYLRELAELLKVDPANLSRELRTLERERLFASRTRGRQKYFRLNRRYPLYEEMRRIVFKTIGVAGQLRDVLSSTGGITEAISTALLRRTGRERQAM
jgi:predicted transcriptional regulator with HTH domain